MENASKALIIAGAILISILLISLGIIIYNQAQSAIGNNGMSEVEQQQFNQKFLSLEGDNKSGSEVRTLIQTVNANNSNEENDSRKVTLEGKGGSFTIATSGTSASGANLYKTSGVKVNHKFTIETSDEDGNGLIDKITVTDKN